mmetsp:Transcript_71716/g.202831  ORF Transcript_71716/g.202831 Transcript_71716/m.202831 type:complete len:226 (+) Transcript_71716:144-821(+)
MSPPQNILAYLIGLLHTLEVSGVVLSGVHLVTRREGGRELVEFLQAVPLVVDRERHDLEAHDARTLELSEVLVVLEDDTDVVVEVVHAVAALEGRRRDEANRETAGHVIVLLVAHGTGEVVNDPVDPVLVVNHRTEQSHLGLVVVLAAEDLARVRHLHLDLVKARLDHVALEHLAEVFRRLLRALGHAERQIIVSIRQLRLGRGDLVHEQRDLVPCLVRLRRDAG